MMVGFRRQDRVSAQFIFGGDVSKIKSLVVLFDAVQEISHYIR